VHLKDALGDIQPDRGSSVLQRTGVRISMDGRGRWLDNVFIERLWRSLKYEEVYLKSYADGREARAGIAAWIVFYKATRPIRRSTAELR
jgi:putative transposase